MKSFYVIVVMCAGAHCPPDRIAVMTQMYPTLEYCEEVRATDISDIEKGHDIKISSKCAWVEHAFKWAEGK